MPSQSFVERIRQYDASQQESFIKPVPPDHPIMVQAEDAELARMRENGIAVSYRTDGTVIKDPERQPAVFPLEVEEASDSRPDLTDDSALWCDLLAHAFAFDGADPRGLYQALHGLRCEGMRLVPQATGGALLTRDAQTTITTEEYAETRAKYLRPHGERLQRMLREVRV